MVAPEAACRNLERLAAEGGAGHYGFYEAIDYTPVAPAARASERRSAVVHGPSPGDEPPGAGLCAAGPPDAEALRRRPGVPGDRRCCCRSAFPRPPRPISHTADVSEARPARRTRRRRCGSSPTPAAPAPEVHLLSNGRYHVMVTNAGGGYSRWQDLAVTRWREDAHLRQLGHLLLSARRDERRSSGPPPISRRSGSPMHQTLRGDLLAVASRVSAPRPRPRHPHRDRVSPEDDIELRRVTLTNRARARRTIEVTSYAEVVLAPPAADALHPAFSNLFVQTEIWREPPGDSVHAPPALGRGAAALDDAPDDRARGGWRRGVVRNRPDASSSAAAARSPIRRRCDGAPAALGQPGLRCSIRSSASGSAFASSRRSRCASTWSPASAKRATPCLGLDRKVSRPAPGRPRLRAGLDAQPGRPAAAQRHRGRCAALRPPGRLDHLRQRLAARRAERARRRTAAANPGCGATASPATCRSCSLQIGDPANIELVRQLVQAHAYWRLKGLAVDLVIWNEDHSVYRQTPADRSWTSSPPASKPTWSTGPAASSCGRESRCRKKTASCCRRSRASSSPMMRGTLEEQVEPSRSRPSRRNRAELPPTSSRPRRPAPTSDDAGVVPPAICIFFNGLGGFTPDGREYVITTCARASDARALGERDRQSELRHRRLRERHCLHVERERPRVPPHAVVQRSR